MCTAASFKNGKTYFGRNLDYEFSYGEKITITPRNYIFDFRHIGVLKSHYAIIGMAHVDNDYPMYYDAVNEKGLAMAGLNFVGNAKYFDVKENAINVAQFEFISYILANYESIEQVKECLKSLNLVKTQYNEHYPASQLHWIIKDSENCIVVESTSTGLHVYDNKTGCLTNNPPFNYQLNNLKNYSFLNNEEGKKTFSFDDSFYSRGMSSIGLPGDLSSPGRFVRVVYTSYFSTSNRDENSCVNQLFYILQSVWQSKGLCRINGSYEITLYSSCMNLEDGIYYYKTYENSSINAVNLKNVDLNTDKLITYELKKESINFQN